MVPLSDLKTGDYIGLHFVHVCALFHCHKTLILIPTYSAQSIIFITVSLRPPENFQPILMPTFQLLHLVLPPHLRPKRLCDDDVSWFIDKFSLSYSL